MVLHDSAQPRCKNVVLVIHSMALTNTKVPVYYHGPVKVYGIVPPYILHCTQSVLNVVSPIDSFIT